MSCRCRTVQRQRRLLLGRDYSRDVPFFHWHGLLQTVESCSGNWSRIINCVRRDLLDDLLGMEEYLDMYGPDGFTPLHFAAALGFKRVSEYLLQHGANASKSNAVYKLPPMETSSLYSSPVPSLQFEPAFGITPLYLAASGGHLEVVDLLLRYGADKESEVVVMSQGLEQFLPCQQNGQYLNLELFPDWAHLTAIEAAAMEGHVAVARKLVNSGAELRSSVIAAALNGYSRVVNVLLGDEWPYCQKHDVGITHASALGPLEKDGTSPLTVVLEHPSMDIRLSDYATLTVQQVLHFVCSLRLYESVLSKVRLLLQHGANINGFTSVPSGYAQPTEEVLNAKPSCGMMCHVVNHRYELNASDPSSWLQQPPIALAIRACNLEVALFLLQCGCSTGLPGGRTVRQELEAAEAAPGGILLLGNGLYDQFTELLDLAKQVRVTSLQMLCRRCIVQHAPGPKRIRKLQLPSLIISFLLFDVN